VRAARAALGVLLALALVVEVGRYRGERRLREATVALRSALALRADDPRRASALARAEALAEEAARELPDGRASIAAGSARLVADRPEEALRHYREALARGERAEVLLNTGRAHMMMGRRDLAQGALVRAGWVSPSLLSALPEVAREPLLGEVRRLEGELRAGRLAAPPPLPPARD